METRTIQTNSQTNGDGLLNLSLEVGVPNAEVNILVRVLGPGRNSTPDANDWPAEYFDRAAGSMPELERAPQGVYEDRYSFE